MYNKVNLFHEQVKNRLIDLKGLLKILHPLTLMTRAQHYDEKSSLEECIKYIFSKVSQTIERFYPSCIKDFPHDSFHVEQV